MSEAVYRRSGMRKFFKVTDSLLIAVENKHGFSSIAISNVTLHVQAAMVEEPEMKEITASEFEEALRIARQRIETQTI